YKKVHKCKYKMYKTMKKQEYLRHVLLVSNISIKFLVLKRRNLCSHRRGTFQFGWRRERAHSAILVNGTNSKKVNIVVSKLSQSASNGSRQALNVTDLNQKT